MNIFYTSTGFNRTTIKFFEVVKESKCFYTLIQIGKFNNEFGINPNRSNIIGSAFRIKKTNSLFMPFKGQNLIENSGYTYTGI